MNYRVECLTPVLVSDGNSLSPIDYMVWKDQINVLDQRKIFRLLARGPRLDGYLLQVKKAQKLDFASWGGFAQNFAGRRIAFEHSSLMPLWERQPAELCHIATFARTQEGSYLPGSALRGALRTALVSSRLDEKSLGQAAEMIEAGGVRRPGEAVEQRALATDGGRGGHDPMKALAIGDSAGLSAAASPTRVYLARVASLAETRDPKAQAAGRPYSLVWKQANGGSLEARRVDDATPLFVEMAAPGTAFTGAWTERGFFRRGEVRHQLRWRDQDFRQLLLEAANGYAAKALAVHRSFAVAAGMPLLGQAVEALEAELAAARGAGSRCLLNIGWGGGLLSKSLWPLLDATAEAEQSHRRILAAQNVWARALRTGLPFPKTRRIVFAGGQPATLPGWVRLEIS